MGPGYFVIAILGCADGSAACTQVATMPTQYESQAACAAAAPSTLAANASFDFPSMMAECKSMRRPARASIEKPSKAPETLANG